MKEEKDREKFEREYVAQHMREDALNSVKSLRNGLTYDDEHVAESYKNWRMSELQQQYKQACAECGAGADDKGLALYCVKCMFSAIDTKQHKRIGDILPEFKS